MIIGTAGHIDHGKSTLVTALTGRPMDRLLEERRREITIELNFAPLDLGAGGLAGVVDVPGHEDFVRTMVAGASGIDLALLVIAGDEGIMPQTLEHLVILERLGVAVGIPVITKADLVDPEWLQLVMLEVSERLQASPVAFDGPLAVSARTGAGIDTLRERLRHHAARVARRSRADGFRLPIDRVFSLPGVGTVVTGTVWSGSLRPGDPLLALPSGQRGRVRSLESFGRAVERSEPGARTAVGIAGMDRAALVRGEVLVSEELPWAASRALDVEIGLQPGAAPLRPRSRVRLLLGTAEVMARVSPRSPILPGGTGIARLSLESPLVARAEDRFVLRSYSPVTTIGGGRVVDPSPPRRGSGWPGGLASRDPGERFRSLMERRPGGIRPSSLPILLGLPSGEAAEIARREPTARLLRDLWVSRVTVEQSGARALAQLREFHRRHPSEPGMPLETLRHGLRAPAEVVEAALDDFARAGRLRVREGLVLLAGFVPKIVGGDAEIDRVVRILADAHLSPPSVAELERSTGRHDLLALLRLAAARGQVEAVERDRYYVPAALDQFVQVLSEMGRRGPIIPAAVRDRLGISRKFLIPLLEWADIRGITVRDADGRRLKSRVFDS
jgi:selenocysteine-specific elongation factor